LPTSPIPHTFNKRHKRAGHLFQNRYKSVICEEDPYLLELIRYIHLNPLRAKLVLDLNELDKYPWSGHSAILGYCKNPLVPEVRDQKSKVSNPKAPSIPSAKGGLFFQFRPETEKDNKHPENPVNPVKDKSLAEKTIEDVLLHFGETQKVARRRYRDFVEKGIAQGRRPEFQGGGLVRSAGGNKAGLLGRSKEEREKGDARILGSGDFVMQALDKANEIFERGFNRPISLDELTRRVTKDKGVDLKELISSKRTQKISDTRAIISYLAEMELRNSGKEIAENLQLSGKSVSRCIGRGKKLFDNDERLLGLYPIRSEGNNVPYYIRD
jgi:putative transposase